MRHFSISPQKMVAGLWHNRQLATSLVKREVVGRYRGSIMGILWSFFNPVLLLVVYTFVFSIVFKARWNPEHDSKTEFALVLFAGLIVFNLFAECINRAPGLILGNTNYVKKVVFPLEILPWVALGSAAFHMLISLVVWIIFYLFFFGLPPVTSLLLPIILLPLALFTLGFSWLLASLGVFFRDVGQFIGIAVTVLMFMTPIFYPITALPPDYQHLLMFNPLTLAVEQMRGVMIWGQLPQWSSYLTYLAASMSTAWLGFAWFQKTRKGFGDVL